MSGWTIAATMAAAAMSAAVAYQQSQAVAAQNRYKAAVARNNAITAQRNADAIVERGKIAEQEDRARTRQQRGSAKAVQGAQGFLVDDTEDSTNVQLLADIAEAGKLDELRTRDKTRLEARRAEIQGVNFTAQAGLFSSAASQAETTGKLSAGANLLSGAAKSAAIYKKHA
jgi:hypothetical protein